MSRYDDTKDTLLVIGILCFVLVVMAVVYWIGVTG